MSDWTKDAAGQIKLHPLTGYSTVLMAQIACGLRLTYLQSAADPAEGSLQLALAPAAARELGQALLQMAAAAEAQGLGRAH